MNKGDNILIIVLLISISALATILILKIHNSSKYDETLYNNIYNEYNGYFKKDEISHEEIIENSNNIDNLEQNMNNVYSNNGNVIGRIVIPSLNVDYPVLKYTTEELLKVAPTKLCGPNINEKGNLCIIGHNYHNAYFFSRLNELNIGENVILTNSENKKELTFVVNKKYVVFKNDLSALSQQNDKEYELTLITCTNNKNERLIVKCNAII